MGLLSRFLQALLIIGFVIEWYSLAGNKRRYFKLGFTMFNASTLAYIFIFLLFPTVEAKLMAMAFSVMLIGHALIVARQLKKFIFKVLVTGAKDDLISFFKRQNLPIEQTSDQFRDGITLCLGFLARKTKPDFEILPEVVLNLSAAPDRGVWRLCLVTSFGVSEANILSIVEEMGVLRDCDSVYYHKQFHSGKDLIHLFDFEPSNWNLSG